MYQKFHFFFSIKSSNIQGNEVKRLTILRIAFADSSCIKYRRSIYLTWEDVLGTEVFSYILFNYFKN